MNLLLVSIDSLRLDSVSRTNPDINTPWFDELAKDFHFCERLFSASSATRPVHTSLFTGLYPFEHGIVGQTDSAVRTRIPHLFDLFALGGRFAGGLSEAHTIFANLPFAPWIRPFAANGVGQATELLNRRGNEGGFLFLHYWSTHTPYGAADGQAWGETGELLRSGQHSVVVKRYRRAVEFLFEEKLAPILRSLDLSKWCVMIFGDHGESWTPVEPYHGVTLRNSVLRVPFYVHLPGVGALSWPRSIISMIDIFPTVLKLFQLDADYTGFGHDIRLESKLGERRLAQIKPVAGRDDLTGALEPTIIGERIVGPSWALFDERRKFTHEVESASSRLEATFEETAIETSPEETAEYMSTFADMLDRSIYARLPMSGVTAEADDLLQERLRALGYL